MKDEKKIVTFFIKNEDFAFDIKIVREIVRIGEITSVPGAPLYLKGITNLRGEILPLIDLRKRLGYDSADYNEDTRVIVVKKENEYTGIIVDKVNEVLSITNENMKFSENTASAEYSEFISNIVVYDDRIIVLLDYLKILPNEEESENIKKSMNLNNNKSMESKKDFDKDNKEKEFLFVCFYVGKEEFAFDINNVKEIVAIKEIKNVPGLKEYYIGAMQLRGKVLPIMDLEKRLNIKKNSLNSELRNRERIIVLLYKGKLIGVKVNAVSEVLRVKESALDIPPDFAMGEDKFIDKVCKLNNSKNNRLISILNPERIINEEGITDFKYEDINEKQKTKEVVINNKEQVVCFICGKEEFGISIEYVKEIAKLSEITEIPGAPVYVKGLINLRGNILPIINFKSVFKNCEKGDNNYEDKRIIVLDVDKKLAGLLVDKITGVFKVDDSMKHNTPDALKNSKAGVFFDFVLDMDNGARLVSVVKPLNIIEAEKYLEQRECLFDEREANQEETIDDNIEEKIVDDFMNNG